MSDPFAKYSRRQITALMILAYMLQFTKRSTAPVDRGYLAEKVRRAARATNEFELVCELDLENLRRYDQCLKELQG